MNKELKKLLENAGMHEANSEGSEEWQAKVHEMMANQIATILWDYAGHRDGYPYIVDDILEKVQAKLLVRQRRGAK